MNRVYRKVLDYVTDAGFIQKLRAHMRVEEKDHFGARDISKSGLAILDAVHCIHDSKRTNAFLKEIAANTRADSVVIEAGIGTGILSFFAATRAKKVYGVEINRHICALANNIQKYLLAENIMPQPVKIYRADATRVRFPEKADVIINENIYTGLFFEKQIQIATHLRKYLKRGGVMIPEALHSYVVLCEVVSKKPLRAGEMVVPLQDRNLKIRALSQPYRYDSVHLSRSMSRGVRNTLHMQVTRAGALNAVLIFTEVHMPSGAGIRRNQTEFLNNDIVLGLRDHLLLRKGQKVQLAIAYPYGGKPEKAHLRPVILR